jgi:Pyridoxamine 5'-phosphate oxidase
MDSMSTATINTLINVPQGDLRLLNDPAARALLGSTEMAHLAYVWRDDTPRCTAIWFHWNGEQLVVVSPASAPKTAAIETGTPVAVTIDDARFPYTSLNLRGTAWVDYPNGIPSEYRHAANRYLGNDAGAAFCQQLPADIVMTRISVEPNWAGLIDLTNNRRLPSALAR